MPRSIDESGQKTHPRNLMDRIGLLLAALLAPAWLSHAAPAPERRAVSLDECLKLALEHNLDLQIERMNPAMRSLDLWGAYSAYDPSFSAQYNHSYRLSPGGFNPQTQTLTIGTEDNTDSGGLGLGGLLPTGLQYSLSGSAYHSYGLGPGTTDARIPYRDSQGTAGISLTQPILKNFWIDGARYSIALRKKDLKISEYTLQRTVMQTDGDANGDLDRNRLLQPDRGDRAGQSADAGRGRSRTAVEGKQEAG